MKTGDRKKRADDGFCQPVSGIPRPPCPEVFLTSLLLHLKIRILFPDNDTTRQFEAEAKMDDTALVFKPEEPVYNTPPVQPKHPWKILIVDDLLATGGTLKATADLVKKVKGEVVGLSCIIELLGLNGRAKLGDLPFKSLVTYDEA